MRPRSYVLAGALLLALFLGFLSSQSLKESVSRMAAPAGGKAFVQTRWGMRVPEVEAARRVRLERVVGAYRFYSGDAPDAIKYESFSEPAAKFLGYPATVTYTFYEGRLKAYHLFAEAPDGEGLDRDLRKYLSRTFGDDRAELENGASLKLLWQSKDRVVNYWFMEDTLALRQKYKAGFGVISKSNQY